MCGRSLIELCVKHQPPLFDHQRTTNARRFGCRLPGYACAARQPGTLATRESASRFRDSVTMLVHVCHSSVSLFPPTYTRRAPSCQPACPQILARISARAWRVTSALSPTSNPGDASAPSSCRHMHPACYCLRDSRSPPMSPGSTKSRLPVAATLRGGVRTILCCSLHAHNPLTTFMIVHIVVSVLLFVAAPRRTHSLRMRARLPQSVKAGRPRHSATSAARLSTPRSGPSALTCLQWRSAPATAGTSRPPVGSRHGRRWRTSAPRSMPPGCCWQSRT